MGYFLKASNNKSREKVLVLTNIGLFYFDDPSIYPKKLIPIVGSTILTEDKADISSFKIKTLNGYECEFATCCKDVRDSWVDEFIHLQNEYSKKLNNILGNYY